MDPFSALRRMRDVRGAGAHMALGDLPIIGMMKQRMHWLSARQQVLAQNVANADTPGYTAQDLKPLDFGALVKRNSRVMAPVATQAGHIGSPAVGSGLNIRPGEARGGEVIKKPDFETSPTGNSVVLEDQMIKVAATQMDYQTVTGLYSKSLGLIKIALGRG
jgi:flagellar basal-body rod protein FlgB